MKRKLKILRNDPWLEPFEGAIEGRHEDAIRKEKELLTASKSLSDFANAHNYFGLHREKDGSWVFREWAPNATAISLTGDFSGWKKEPAYALKRLEDSDGVWEGRFPADALKDGQLYKMLVEWPGGSGERIPAYATRVLQDPDTHIFSAEVYVPARAGGKSRTSIQTRIRCSSTNAISAWLRTERAWELTTSSAGSFCRA